MDSTNNTQQPAKKPYTPEEQKALDEYHEFKKTHPIKTVEELDATVNEDAREYTIEEQLAFLKDFHNTMQDLTTMLKNSKS